MSANSKKKIIYTLHTPSDTLCVCTSKKALKEAINYWMNERPLTTLSWLEWEPNYMFEPNSWSWAYIPLNAKPEVLGAGGGWVPPKTLWDKNLLEIDTLPYYEQYHQELLKDLYKEEQC